MKRYAHYASAALLFFITMPGFAQVPEWEEGEIEDREVVIEKDREIVLPYAPRAFDKIPPWKTEAPQVASNYQFKTFDFKPAPFIPISRFSPENPAAKPLRYQNLLKAGFGNYSSPLAEAYLQTAPSDLYSAGLDFRHLSFARGPVDGRNSASSDTDLNIGGKVYGKKIILSGDVGYQHSKVFFYGYDRSLEVDRDSIEQQYNWFNVDFNLKQADREDDISYDLMLKFNRASDNRFDVAENDFLLGLKLGYQLNEALGLKFDTDLHFINFNNFESVNRNLFRFYPWARFQKGNLTIDGGVRLVKENGVSFNEKSFHVYPIARASYDINRELQVYAGIDGDLELLNYRSLIQENRFLFLTNNLTNSNKQYDIFAGIKGGIAAKVSYETGIAYRSYENLYFYANNASDSAGFDLLYDDVNVLNFYAALGVQANDQFDLSARFDYFNYNLDVLAEAWHRPNYQLTLLGQYQVTPALNLGAEIYFIGGLEGLNLESINSRGLDDIFDLNLSAHYQITDRFGAFLTLNNLLSKRYERYLNYENRGFMIHVGATFTF